MGQLTLFSGDNNAQEDDVTRNRHGGNPESIEANNSRQHKARQRALVYAAIVTTGKYGMTVDELSASWNVPPNQISGRFSELKRDCLVEKVGTRRTRGGNPAGVCVAASLLNKDK